MASNALYTDLSGYYDLMCDGIDYRAQSDAARRLQHIFGNRGRRHLDLACGTGPHIRHLLDFGYQSSGLDINPPMLELARLRCPEAQFAVQDMADFRVEQPFDLITCFLYSIHYNAGLDKLRQCLASVHAALGENGVFCFNSVDKHKIDNTSGTSHAAEYDNSRFVFTSGWHYGGSGNRQTLKLAIERTTLGVTQSWQDEHPMVATGFDELQDLLRPLFDVHVFEHDYERITPWDQASGNALFVCVKN